MIAYNNVKHLVEVKTTEKNFGNQILQKQAKIGPEISFFCHFLKFGSLVFLEIHTMIADNNV